MYILYLMPAILRRIHSILFATTKWPAITSRNLLLSYEGTARERVSISSQRDACRVCVRSPGDRVKIEGSSTVVRTRGNRLCGLHGFLPSVSSPPSLSPSPLVLSSECFANDDVSNTISAPSAAPADGFHTDVPKGIGPRRWRSIIRLWNRGDAQYR